MPRRSPPSATSATGGVAADCAGADDPTPRRRRPARRGRRPRVALEVVAASGADVDGARVTAEAGRHALVRHGRARVDGLPSGLAVLRRGRRRRWRGGLRQRLPRPARGARRLPAARHPRRHRPRQRADGQRAGIEPALGDADAMSGTTGGTDTGGDGRRRHDRRSRRIGSTAGRRPVRAARGRVRRLRRHHRLRRRRLRRRRPPPPPPIPCKVQPDGREICEPECARGIGPSTGPTPPSPCDVPPARRPVPGRGRRRRCPRRPSTARSRPIPAWIRSAPEPQPLEIVLVDAEPSLVLLPANDGSADAYLVPGLPLHRRGRRHGRPPGGRRRGPRRLRHHRHDRRPTPSSRARTGPRAAALRGPRGGRQQRHHPHRPDLPHARRGRACADRSATATTSTSTSSAPAARSSSAARSGCTDDEDVAGWADPGERHEGGIFTLDAEDHGTFVGDAAGTLTAEFRALGPAEDIFCTPEPR